MAHHGRGRGWLAVVAGASLVASGIGMGGASADAPVLSGPDSASDKVNSEVRDQLDSKGETDFWVHFEARPDMSQFSSMTNWDARGQAVYDALTKSADTSQKQVRADLEADGVRYQSYFITNAIKVTAGDEALVNELAANSKVDGIYPSFEVTAPDPQPVKDPVMSPDAVEWGIADINADDVWADFGDRGEGMVVANIDTGVQYDHPALVNQYRGNNEDGTFDHDYNWLDVQGDSPFPTDYNGHGSHTMGTMVGDDGGANQIGVAPGAKWIAASGCCPSDAALIESGEWMLAPTKVDGTDPDPSKRPNVVNNSWGSELPSNDPFMEDVSEAWNAAGIFGVFSNGNSGPECETSGSPGSRIVNYSVGAYDVNRDIAYFSGRGPGQDGEIKPNIAAPGVNIRSSVPGNGYANYNGTSMAAPHLAGTIALLWSAAPGMVGDVTSTRNLLDDAAIDTEDLQCGGTADDNNVWGEGRLDALVLLNDAPIGATGTLDGTVTDAASGDPIADAQVLVDGDEIDRTLTTDADGHYQALLVAGDYTITVSKFGYGTETATVTIEEDATVTQDFALDPAASATITGTVTDGSGYGFPLYAKISVDGTAVHTYTDPETGEYSISLPTGTTYTLTAQAQYPGYESQSKDENLTGDAVVDFELTVDANTCSAPGYEYDVQGVTETFDAETAPPGWTVVDNVGNGQVWLFNNPDGRDNLTGGEGNFAIMDSDFYGAGGEQDTSLVSPVVDMSALTSPAIGFKQDYNNLGDIADVDLSIDGGTTWTTVLHQTEDARGPNEQFLQIPDAAGQAEVQVRFHSYEMDWDWWWEVDDVFIGTRDCLPTGTGGGYVVGNVYGTETGDGIVGAKVTNLDFPEETATTVATPDDENLDDGFYWIFSSHPGTHPFEATASDYESVTQDVTVEDGGAVRADFTLGSGFLVIDPTSIETTVMLGESATEDMTITNNGTGAAQVELSEVPGDFTILRPDGTKVHSSKIEDADGAPLIREKVATSFAQQVKGDKVSNDQANRGPAEEPWTNLGNYPEDVMDNRVVNVDGVWYGVGGSDGTTTKDSAYRYNAEAMAWEAVAPTPTFHQAATLGVIDGQIIVAQGWADGDPTGVTDIYDPASDSWSSAAEAPTAVSAAGQAVADGLLYSVGGCSTADCTPMTDAVQAYDPGSDSWTELADYPEQVAFVSCGGIDGQIYCTGGNNGLDGIAASYMYDPAADSWSAIDDAPADQWASSYAAANGMLIVNGGVQGGAVTNRTFAYDTEAGAWVDLPNSNTAVYRGGAACGFAKVGGSAGGFTPTADAELLPGYDDCGATAGADVPWLSLDDYAFTVAPGETVTVEVTTDSSVVTQPGDYTAGIKVKADVPQDLPTIDVTMHVTAPLSWGKLMGNVSGEDCDEAVTPLPGAIVDVEPVSDSYTGWTLSTDADGNYALWVDTRVGKVEVIATHADYRPESAMVTIARGTTVVQDFLLRLIGCDTPPGPVHPEVIRVSGDDRYGTAVEVSKLSAPGVDTVFVATGKNYPDALAAAARAGAIDSPVLLTRPNSVPGVTLAELGRLDADNVIVLGGTAAISKTAWDQIDIATGDAVMRRIYGDDRYGTAAKIAQETDASDVVYIATGENYPDALAGAARAGAVEAPVLLVRQDSVPAATAGELDRLAPDDIVILGGTNPISEDVEDALGAWGDVTRVAGDDRYGTAALIAQDYDTSAQAFVASGENWPDALAGAARAGSQEAPLVLVRHDRIPVVTWTELDRLDPETIYVLGGTAAIIEDVLDELRTLD